MQEAKEKWQTLTELSLTIEGLNLDLSQVPDFSLEWVIEKTKEVLEKKPGKQQRL
jgi:hypothetical protein